MSSVLKYIRPGLLQRAVNVNWNGVLLSKANRDMSSSSHGKEDTNEKVVLTDDGRVIVCWHPEVEVPYEMTKPLPVEVAPTDSILKVQALRPTRELFRGKHERLVIDELMQLTHTSKYSWLPKRRRLRYKDMNPLNEKRDREYL